MRKILIIILFQNIFLCSNLVTSIEIFGNNKISTQAILNVINHPINTPFNSDIAKEDQIKIYNLNYFSYVHIKYENSKYLVLVKEKIYDLHLEVDKIDGLGWTYGPNISIYFDEYNQLELQGTTGDINSGFLKYTKKIENNLNNNFIFFLYSNKNKSVESDYEINNYGLEFNYRIKFKYSTVNFILNNQYNDLSYNNLDNEYYHFNLAGVNYTKKNISQKYQTNFTINYSNHIL